MPLDLSRIKGVCFDLDGTLSDTDDEWTNRLQHRLHAVRFLFKNQDPTSFARWVVMSSESPANAIYHLMDHLSLDDTFASLYERFVRARRSTKQSFILMDHATELLELASSRFQCSIVSARDELSTMRFVDQFQLARFFRVVVSAQTCGHTKPFPDPMLYAAQAMGVKPEECVMIGDTTVDILAGKAVGAQTIGVLCGFGGAGELRKAGADLILKDLHEVIEAFKG